MTDFTPEENEELKVDAEVESRRLSALETFSRSLADQHFDPHFIGDEVAPVEPVSSGPGEVRDYEWAQRQIATSFVSVIGAIPEAPEFASSTHDTAVPSVSMDSGQPSGVDVPQFDTHAPSPPQAVELGTPFQIAAPEPVSPTPPVYNPASELSGLKVEPPKAAPSAAQPIDSVRNGPSPTAPKFSQQAPKPVSNRPREFAPRAFWEARPAVPIAAEDAANPVSNLGDQQTGVNLDFLENQDRTNQLMVSVLDGVVSSMLSLQTRLQQLERVIERSFGGP